MGRTEASEEIRQKFLMELRREEIELQRLGASFYPLSKNAEIYITTPHNDRPRLLFFIKVWSKTKNGFWGLNKSLFKAFHELFATENSRHYIVLLDGPRRGYVLNGDEFDELSQDKEPDKKGDYKIMANDLNDQLRFYSVNKMVEMLNVA